MTTRKFLKPHGQIGDRYFLFGIHLILHSALRITLRRSDGSCSRLKFILLFFCYVIVSFQAFSLITSIPLLLFAISIRSFLFYIEPHEWWESMRKHEAYRLSKILTVVVTVAAVFFFSSFLFCLTFVTLFQHSLKMHWMVQWRFSLPLSSGGCFYYYYLHHAVFLFFSFVFFSLFLYWVIAEEKELN